jgi:SAM-dependent methyltransferase
LSANPIDGYHGLIRTDILQLLPHFAGRVLDFGGGIGATSVALKRAGRASSVVVADQVVGQLDEVDGVYHGDLDDREFIKEFIQDSGPFNTILALDVLEHLRDPWSVVEQLHSALAPSGLIVASIPNVNYHRLVLPLLLKGTFTLTDSGILDRTHLRWFERNGAEQLLSGPGLIVEEVQANIVSRRERLLYKMSFGSLRRFLALQYVVRARRVD